MANQALTATSSTKPGDGFTVYKLAWLSDDGAGTVSLPFTLRSGRLSQVKTVPSATAVPTNLYDLTILDSDSADILQGDGADLSSTVAAWSAQTNEPYLEGGTYTFTIAAAGNAKGGIVYLYVR